MQSTKFEFAINLQAAKLLRIEAPPTLLATADEVVERNGGSSSRALELWGLCDGPTPGGALVILGFVLLVIALLFSGSVTAT